MRGFRCWILVFLLVCLVEARRHLTASSLVPCMLNSQLTATTFEVSFDPDAKTLSYNLDLNSGINGYVTAKAEVFAYGFRVISETINLCNLPFKQFCPLYSGEVIVDSTETISSSYVDMIPGIAYTVPDIDAYVKVTVFDSNNGTQLACMAAYFSNGKTVSHTGAKWATAVVAGLGLFVSAVLSAFGNSNAASHISVNSLSLFSYFQSVVTCAMLHVTAVPPIASAWAENLAWSMGLIRITFMQKIFRWYIQATGGHPTMSLVYAKKAILVQRAINYLKKRAPALVVNSSSKLTVLRGIKRIGYKANIEDTSIVVTGFTFFILCGYVLAGVILFAKLVLELLVKVRIAKNPNAALYFRANYKVILKGAILRYIAIGFTQLTIFSLWEFTQRDSPAVIVLSVLFLLLAIGISGWAALRAFAFGRKSVHKYKNPAAILYGNQHVLDKYGFSYTMYNANLYWWALVFLGYAFVKAVFVGLCQASGKTQSLVLFVLDLAYLIALIKYKPYLDKSTNILNMVISTVVCLNSFMFMFFSNLFNQPAAVSSIMGWVFFILNAAFSLILLIVVIIYIAIAVLSKVPDARFRQAKDDRTSFQRNSTLFADEKSLASDRNSYAGAQNSGAEELLDLGKVAKTHQNNWETEMYRLQDLHNSNPELANGLYSKDTLDKLEYSSSGSALNNKYDPNLYDEQPVHMVNPSATAGATAGVAALGSKLAHSLSLKRKAPNAAGNPLSRKLSAMKLSTRNNNNVPLPNNSINPTNSQRQVSAHQRTLSATPITSPNADDSFHFVNSDNEEYERHNVPTTHSTDILNRPDPRRVSKDRGNPSYNNYNY